MNGVVKTLRQSRAAVRKSVNLALLSIAINAVTLVLLFWGPR